MKGHNFTTICLKCGKIHIHPRGMFGKVGPNKGKIFPEEWRKHISESRKKMFQLHPEHARAFGDLWRGKTVEEVLGKERALLRLSKIPYAQKGHPPTNRQFGKDNPHFGKENYYYEGRGRGFRNDLGFFCWSKWEANIFRILKYLGVKFIPASKFARNNIRRFIFDNMTYNPDAYLPEWDLYLEIKGFKDALFFEKMRLLAFHYPEVKLVVIDTPIYKNLIDKFKNRILME